MSDDLKERLVLKEEAKDPVHDLEKDYLQKSSRVTVAPNTNFEFNPKNLTSPAITAKDLRAKIEEYLDSDGLTRDQVKLLLKQGAEDNNLFMLKEETYDKLVNSLGLKLDNDNNNDMSNISGLLATARMEFNTRFSQAPNMKLDATASKFADMMKSRQILRDKSAWNVNALPIKKGVEKQEMRQTAQSINEDASSDEDEPGHEASGIHKLTPEVKYDPRLMERVPKITNQGLKNTLIGIVLTIISCCCFIIFALVTYFTRRGAVVEVIGYGLLFSRGSALAIMVMCNFLLIFVSYDFLTCCRPICARHCLSVLDFNIHFHKICGYLILFYSCLHSICHLAFSVPAVSNPDLFAKVHLYFSNTEGMRRPLAYWEVALTTIPGLSGLLLWAIIIIMYLTSLEKVRRSCFQVFAYFHVILFPFFFIGILVHGGARWLNFGFPTGLIFIPVPFTIYFIMIFRRLLHMCRRPFKVADVSIVSTKDFVHLSLVKPPGFTWKSGQYAFINIPAIHPFQWHPFSIASSPNSDYLCFMIKRAGDWTGKLIDTFYDIKEQGFKESIEGLVDERFEKEFRQYLMQMNVEITPEVLERNAQIFPNVYVSHSVSAPAEMAANRRRLILIGAGSGIAPFLAFLDDQHVKAEGGRMRDGELAKSYREEFRSTEKAHLILTSRDADQFSWLSPYLDRIMKNDHVFDKIQLHLYLTSTKCNTLASFLFWRAFMMREQKKKAGLSHSANPIVGSSISLNVGRPDFEKIIKGIHEREPGDFFVYACAPDIIVKQAMAACNTVSQEGNDKFLLRYEIF